MGTFWQNLRYGMRMLGKSPGFTAVAVLTLALGIGANTAIFSVVYAALLRPLPYRQPERLLTLAEGRHQQIATATDSAYPDYLDWKRQVKSFQSLAGFSFDIFTMSGHGDPKNVYAAQVTPNFFATLGVKPMLGRDFVDDEDKSDGPHVAMLTYSYWRSEFSGDRGVVGSTLALDGKPVTIVGVLPREFEFAPTQGALLWVPLHPVDDMVTRRSLRWLNVIGRLTPGVSPDAAQAEMNTITAQLAKQYPTENGAIFTLLGSLREKIIGKIRPLLLVLFGAVGFVLLIACANVAGLLIARSSGRRKEFAIRLALGASRRGLLAQLLTESLLLSFAGAAVGFFAAQWCVGVLLAAIPEAQMQAMPFLRDAGINFPVLGFLVGVTLLTGILFGVAPGLAVSRVPLGEALKDESRSGTSLGHPRLRNALVIGEIAISLVLLIGAGLMLRSLRALLRQNPGFEPQNVLTFDVNLPDASYPKNPDTLRFQHEYLERLRHLPGVRGAAATTSVPLSGNNGTIRFVIEGRPIAAGQEDECDIRSVNTEFFAVMQVPLIAGRYFQPTDLPDAPKPVIVNQAFVRSYFTGENPLGKRVRFTYSAKQTFREIVGVVGDVAEDDLAAPPSPAIYTAMDQVGDSYISFVIRTAGDPGALAGAARSALREIDPQLALINPQSLERMVEQSPAVFLRRLPSYLIGSFAGLALVLAMVGLYGLISYTVLQRTREIGIRIALGAQSRDILRMVLRQGTGAILAGIGAGIVAALALTRLMASLLYGVAPSDAMTFAGVTILLSLVAFGACAIPARRATRVDPLAALRYE